MENEAPTDPDLLNLTLADPKDTQEALAFSLLFRTGKRVHDSDRFMASIVAERLAGHLKSSGFVIMKKPPARGYTTPPPEKPHRT